MVIDDDEIQHFILKRMLFQLRPDLAMVSAMSAMEGKDLLETNTGLILLDLHMPGMSGWDLLAYWKDMALTLPPLFIFSSSPDPHDMDLAEKNPLVSGYLMKPADAKLISYHILPFFPED